MLHKKNPNPIDMQMTIQSYKISTFKSNFICYLCKFSQVNILHSDCWYEMPVSDTLIFGRAHRHNTLILDKYYGHTN